MNKKILFTDLDDTLLNSEKQVCEENQKAIQKMLDAGHSLVLTSGRSLSSVIVQAKRLCLTSKGCYLIAYNGSQIYDIGNEHTLYRCRLPYEVIPGIFELCEKERETNPLVHVHTYNDENVLASRVDDALLKYCHDIVCTYQIVDNVPKFVENDLPSKILVSAYYDHSILEKIHQIIQKRYGKLVDSSFSYAYHLDIVPKGINKGSAIKKLAELTDTPIEDTYAAGDAMNDYSMIQAAGTGCVVANGEQELKDIADYITTLDNNHGGVAEIINNFILT